MGAALSRAPAQGKKPRRRTQAGDGQCQSQVCAPKLPGPERDRKGTAEGFFGNRSAVRSSATPLCRAVRNGCLCRSSAQLGQAPQCKLLVLAGGLERVTSGGRNGPKLHIAVPLVSCCTVRANFP